MRQLVTSYTVSGRTITVSGMPSFGIENIRLIVNETKKIVICSSMQKDNIISVSSGVITYSSTIDASESTDKMTIEIDFGVSDAWLSQEITANSPVNFLDYLCSTAYRNKITTINDADGNITRLAITGAFQQNTALRSISFPECTGVVSGYVFQGCTSLQSINLPELTTISTGSYMFQGCASLTSVSIPKLTTISTATYMFHGCTSLQSISLPEITEITTGDRFLGDCTSLTSVSMPKLRTLGSAYCFINSTGLQETTLEFPLLENTVSFRYVQCKELIIPNAVNVGNYSFQNAGYLRRLKLGTLTTLNTSNVFTGCGNLIDIEIGQDTNITLNFSTWSPTNALKSNSTTLVDEGETFSSNLEKLLYNIRTHIAAKVKDLTGDTAKTITFNANVKTAINADAATVSAFTSKNWTIA